MEEKLTRKKVWAMLRSGMTKAEVFNKFKNDMDEVATKKLALNIAIYPDPVMVKRSVGKIWFLVLLIIVYAALSIYMLKLNEGYRWDQIKPDEVKIGIGITVFISLLLVVLIKRNWIGGYNACIVLPLIPTAGLLSVLIGLPLAICAWWVKDSVFPYQGFAYPKKVNGKYTFLDEALLVSTEPFVDTSAGDADFRV